MSEQGPPPAYTPAQGAPAEGIEHSYQPYQDGYGQQQHPVGDVTHEAAQYPGQTTTTSSVPQQSPHPLQADEKTGLATSYPPPPQQQPSNVPAPRQSYDPASYPPPPAAGHPVPGSTATGYQPPLPPRRTSQYVGDNDPSNLLQYTRDPHKLTVYLVAFPKPHLRDVAPDAIPTRFLIYTPPPPPLSRPAEGEKESKIQKLQRKWQDEVREAKTGTAKTASWKGVKGKATKGINWAMSQTKTSNLDFLNRLADNQKSSGNSRSPSPNPVHDAHTDDGIHEDDTTRKTVGLDEMLLIYPQIMTTTQSADEIRAEFINSMMRSKSKAQRDAIIATGLLPVSAAIDLLATVIWPFGGLLEVDGVWAYASIRGAKTSRSVTKRLTSTGHGKHDEDQLKLNFVPSSRLEVLDKYLAEACHKRDAKLFQSPGVPPSESDVLEAIGWHPSQTGGEARNWEDEQWERTEVKDDIRMVCGKAAKEWDKWCRAFEKDPEKAMKK